MIVSQVCCKYKKGVKYETTFSFCNDAFYLSIQHKRKKEKKNWYPHSSFTPTFTEHTNGISLDSITSFILWFSVSIVRQPASEWVIIISKWRATGPTVITQASLLVGIANGVSGAWFTAPPFPMTKPSPNVMLFYTLGIVLSVENVKWRCECP